MAVSGRVPLLALIHAQAADCLVHRVQDLGPVLGEEVTVNVLGRLDPAMPHLMGDLYVGRARGDQQRRADVAQLVRGIADDPIGLGSGVALSWPSTVAAFQAGNTPVQVILAGWPVSGTRRRPRWPS